MDQGDGEVRGHREAAPPGGVPQGLRREIQELDLKTTAFDLDAQLWLAGPDDLSKLVNDESLSWTRRQGAGGGVLLRPAPTASESMDYMAAIRGDPRQGRARLLPLRGHDRVPGGRDGRGPELRAARSSSSSHAAPTGCRPAGPRHRVDERHAARRGRDGLVREPPAGREVDPWVSIPACGSMAMPPGRTRPAAGSTRASA